MLPNANSFQTQFGLMSVETNQGPHSRNSPKTFSKDVIVLMSDDLGFLKNLFHPNSCNTAAADDDDDDDDNYDSAAVFVSSTDTECKLVKTFNTHSIFVCS